MIDEDVLDHLPVNRIPQTSPRTEVQHVRVVVRLSRVRPAKHNELAPMRACHVAHAGRRGGSQRVQDVPQARGRHVARTQDGVQRVCHRGNGQKRTLLSCGAMRLGVARCEAIKTTAHAYTVRASRGHRAVGVIARWPMIILYCFIMFLFFVLIYILN